MPKYRTSFTQFNDNPDKLHHYIQHLHEDRSAGNNSFVACKLTFDLLTLKVVSESRVTWATSVPILVFLGFSVLDLGPMYATDRDVRRQTSDAHRRLMIPLMGAGRNNNRPNISHISRAPRAMRSPAILHP